MEEPTREEKIKLYMCYNALVDKKAEEVLLLDLRGITNITDFFVICHGSSTRQVQAITDNVEKVFKGHGHKRYHIEGMEKGNWVLMDFQDMVVHIFHQPARSFYSLEKLWSDAGRFDANDIIAWGTNWP